jgi:ADP-heptose:LPS heptosyltransferase
MAPDLWSPAPRRIAVFRALALGDLLCAVPALRALRAHAPAAHITLIGLPWAETFVERFHAYLDDFLPFPGYPGYPEREGTIPAFLDFLRAAHARRFDLAIQLHGSGELTNRIVALLGAPRIAGFVNNEGQTPIDVPPPANNEGQTPIEVPPSGGQWVSDPHFLPWPAQAPEVHRYLRLMEFLGAAGKGDHLELPLTWTDWEAWEEVAKRHRLHSGAYVCLHPGARLRSRRWPVERFAAVGCALAEDGWQVVVTGSAEEAGLASELIARLP